MLLVIVVPNRSETMRKRRAALRLKLPLKVSVSAQRREDLLSPLRIMGALWSPRVRKTQMPTVTAMNSQVF